MSDAAGPLILLVEDNPDDALLIQLSFEKARIINRLKVVRSGEEAVAYLKGEGKYADREEHPLPKLMLLDLRLPGIDGFEVLRWVRGRAKLRGLRVVVLTSSTDVRDANLAFELGADAFVIKPGDFLAFASFSERLGGCLVWNEPGLRRKAAA